MEEIVDGFLNVFKKPFPWSTDPDSRSRQCTVSLYARTIGSGLSEHWALHFDWGDYGATYEIEDVDGYLIPRWFRGPPEQFRSYDWRVLQQFKTTCSPQEVNTKARSISDNGNTYVLTKRNCHIWCGELASKLGICLEQPIEKDLPKEVCNAIDLGYCVFSSLSPLSTSQSGGQATSASTGEVVSPGRLATTAVSCYRNREALAFSSRVAGGSTGAKARTATTDQASGDGAAMVAIGVAMMASFAISSFIEGLDDSKTRTRARNN